MNFLNGMPKMPNFNFAEMANAYMQAMGSGTVKGGPAVNLENMTTDSVDLTAQAAEASKSDAETKETEETQGKPRNAATENAGDFDKFSQTFTKDNVASLLGLDPKNLTEQQNKDLTELLYNLNTANAEREKNGQPPMTKDELNQFLADEINKNKNGETSSLGKSLSELGVDELSDEQFQKINDALNAYNKGENLPTEEKPEDAQETQQPQDAGGANEAGGGGGAGGAGGVGGPGGAKEAGKGNQEEKLPDNLDELQQMKSKEEGELGDLKNQIDDKKGQINDRKEQVAKEALGDKTTLEERKNLKEYQDAKKEFNEAKTAKQTAQNELTKAEQDSCANEQALCNNANQKAQNSAELSAAQSELASLKPPTPPSGDDEDGSAQAAYQAELEAYNAKKAELESKINKLNAEKSQLEAEFTKLQQTKADLEKTKTDKKAEVTKQDGLMQEAQKKMDDAMKALTEESPEVKEALEKDEQLKALQKEVDDLEKQVTEKQAHIDKIDSKIAEVEAQDENVQAMREEEADQAFQKAAKEAGADIEGSIEKTQEAVAQDKYGKAYDDLTEDEKRAIEVEVDGQVTTETMQWAKDRLKEDPENKEAKAVLEKGQVNLDAQKDAAFCGISHAIDKMPRGMRDGASEAMEEAIKKAEDEGKDANAAAMEALSKFVSENKDSADLDDEGRAAMKELGIKTDDYAKTLQNESEGYDMLVDAGLAEADPSRLKATDETSALYAQVKTGAMSQNIASMLEAMKGMVGLSEHNSSDAAKINEITRKSGINCQTTPWCAAYAMNMLKDFGVLDSSTCSNINYCPTIRSWAKDQGLWENRGNGYAPQPGDAILFDWNGNGTAQHIGVVSRYDPETGTIYTIEGNSSDSVREKSYSINQSCVMGFINCGKQQQ